MSFEWDEPKNLRNDLKHDIRFEEAVVIWEDTSTQEFFDEDHSEEERYIKIGLNPYRGILMVVFCERVTGEGEEKIRIISARRATYNERKVYEEGI